MKRTSPCILAALICGGVAMAQDVKPTPLPNPAGASAVFDGRGQFTLLADPAFQLHDSYSIEFSFVAAWDAETLPEDDIGCFRAVLSCNKDEENVRFTVYIDTSLSAISFYNGQEWAEADFAFERDRPYNVVVVVSSGRTAFVVNGEPIAVENVGAGRTTQQCEFFVGSAGNDKECFIGAVGPVRLWDVPLSYNEIRHLQAEPFGVPSNTALAQHLILYSEFSPSNHVLAFTQTITRAELVWRGSQFRLEEPFVSAVQWRRSVADAAKEAAAGKKLVLAYCSRGDDRDLICDAFEGIVLSSPWWKDASARVIPYLEIVTGPDAVSSLGVTPGFCALLTPEGELLRVFQPWDEDQFECAITMASGYVGGWRTGTSIEDRARVLQFDLSRSPVPNAEQRLQALTKEATDTGKADAIKALLAEVATSIQQVNYLEQVGVLQVKYAQQRAERFKNGAEAIRPGEKSWDDDLKALEEEAVTLYVARPMPIEQEQSLSAFAVLVCGGVARMGDPDLLNNVMEFAAPMGSMNAMLGLELRSMFPISTTPAASTVPDTGTTPTNAASTDSSAPK